MSTSETDNKPKNKKKKKKKAHSLVFQLKIWFSIIVLVAGFYILLINNYKDVRQFNPTL